MIVGDAAWPSTARACEVPGTGLSHSANHHGSGNPLRCSYGAGVVVSSGRIVRAVRYVEEA
jgi:hypothetical protein